MPAEGEAESLPAHQQTGQCWEHTPRSPSRGQRFLEQVTITDLAGIPERGQNLLTCHLSFSVFSSGTGSHHSSTSCFRLHPLGRLSHAKTVIGKEGSQSPEVKPQRRMGGESRLRPNRHHHKQSPVFLAASKVSIKGYPSLTALHDLLAPHGCPCTCHPLSI